LTKASLMVRLLISCADATETDRTEHPTSAATRPDLTKLFIFSSHVPVLPKWNRPVIRFIAFTLAADWDYFFFAISARLRLIRTDAKISDAVCWNERGGMPSVWRSQMHHLFLRLSLEPLALRVVNEYKASR